MVRWLDGFTTSWFATGRKAATRLGSSLCPHPMKFSLVAFCVPHCIGTKYRAKNGGEAI